MKPTCLAAVITLLAVMPLAAQEASAPAQRTKDLNISSWEGLCVQVGADEALTRRLAANPRLVVHCLDLSEVAVRRLNQTISETPGGAMVIVERWDGEQLPFADNLVNTLIVSQNGSLDQREALRVVRPGSKAYFAAGDSYKAMEKPRPTTLDNWTHQWHGADGGLVSEDQTIDVPQGVRWLAGPLFAMAGRKSSTQSLVSAGGRNFYVTQNTLGNVGQSEMPQYLVARDAFNGLLLWEQPWTGPFVTGKGETNPRIVASADRLYIAGETEVVALNASTGATVGQLPLAGEADKLALVGSLVLIQTSGGVVATDPLLQSVVWRFQGTAASGMVIDGQKAYVLVSGRSDDGNFRHDLVCLDLASGDTLWSVNTQPYTTASRVRINFAADGFVALQSHGFLHLVSGENGEHLWTRETDARPGKTYVDERFVGHFYRLGLVWMLAENSPREPTGQNVWTALDPATGEVKRRLTTQGDWPRTATPAKMGCQVLIASDRYIMIPRQATFIDIETGEKLPFKFARGGCGLGFVPANGLVYSHPHACGCFSEAIRGFMAMHSTKADWIATTDMGRLDKGPAWGKQAAAKPATAADWPMYRYDQRRGASSPVALSGELSARWSAQITPVSENQTDRAWRLRNGNRITPATVAGNMAYVADVNRGRLVALNLADGEEAWSFTAAGRIDSPPTIAQGRCVFGSHDGYVYCLDASSGELVWRRQAAPVDRRIVAYGSVESIWPVAGSALIRGDTVFAAAGRAPDADGGIAVLALQLESGEVVWSARTDSGAFEGVCDYLVGGDDGAVYLSNWRYDAETGQQSQAPEDADHLRGGKAGLLETSWTKHDLAVRKAIQTWTASQVAGQLLAFSPQSSAAYNAEAGQLTFEGPSRWSLAIPEPAQLTGLALCKTHVAAAAGLNRADRLEGGRLWLLERKSGKIASSIGLPAEPVLDGVAIAQGVVLTATQDGQLHCFESSQEKD